MPRMEAKAQLLTPKHFFSGSYNKDVAEGQKLETNGVLPVCRGNNLPQGTEGWNFYCFNPKCREVAPIFLFNKNNMQKKIRKTKPRKSSNYQMQKKMFSLRERKREISTRLRPT